MSAPGRWWQRASLRAWASLGLALALGFTLLPNRQELARHLVPLVLVWAPLLALALSPALLRHWRQILLMLGGLAVALGGLWLVGPLIVGRWAMPQFNLDLDHRPKPAPGRFNADGVAPDLPAGAYSPDDFVIVFLGDSFTQGYMLDDPLGGFPFLVEKRLQKAHPELSIRVVDFGYVSSSPVLQLRQLRDLGARYHPDLVVQCFDMSDFANDLEYSDRLHDLGVGTRVDLDIFRTVAVWASWSLGVADYGRWLGAQGTPRGPRPNEALWRDSSLFPMKYPLGETWGLMETSWEAITDTGKLARGLGADFALVVLPRYQQFDPSACPEDWEAQVELPHPDQNVTAPFDYFAQKAAGAAFPVHSCQPAFQAAVQGGRHGLVFPNDPHYTPAGHEVAAADIADFLEREGLIPRAQGTSR
ncbi:MAG: hypothetical protein ABIO70_26750 [Pseudomonadota bacterium]